MDKNKLALDILRYSRKELRNAYPYLGPVLYALQMVRSEKTPWMGTDGFGIYYNPDAVVKVYRKAPEEIPLTIMHLIVHCILGHTEKRTGREHLLYDSCCDVAALQITSALKGVCGRDPRKSLPEIKAAAKFFCGRSAEQCYEMIRQERIEGCGEEGAEAVLAAAGPHAVCDDHRFWGMDPQKEGRGVRGGRGTESLRAAWRRALTKSAELYGKALKRGEIKAGRGMGMLFSQSSVTEVSPVSYREILKRFAAPAEVMKVDMDTMDLAWYVTGLDLYGDLPIIEYNEYRDVNVVEEFIIAIDTSGSCCGETLNDFLKQTAAVVRDMEVTGRKFRLRIIQCDWDIQVEKEIRTEKEFDQYMGDFELRGGGGTSFKPVFRRVEELMENGEYRRLRGLIFFSDGMGDFPEKPASYETVFVIPGDLWSDCETMGWIPDWVTVALLGEGVTEPAL